MKEMKKFFAVVLIFCLAFSLTACGGDKTPSETGGATKDTLVWVQSADVTSLDPVSYTHLDRNDHIEFLQKDHLRKLCRTERSHACRYAGQFLWES